MKIGKPNIAVSKSVGGVFIFSCVYNYIYIIYLFDFRAWNVVHLSGTHGSLPTKTTATTKTICLANKSLHETGEGKQTPNRSVILLTKANRYAYVGGN